MASLSISGVTKAFGPVTAVNNLDLDIHDGELQVLVGPSGCGKTTVLRMIAGLESPDSGSIQIDGRDVARVAPKNRDVAMVFQNNALYPHMTTWENIAFGLRQSGATAAQIESRVQKVSEQLKIRDILSRLPGEVSGGQQQRVALGRAIARRPAVYLFDEPLSDLDADLRTKLRTEVKRLHRKLGRTMIYVTHDQTEAMTLADRIVVLKDGCIQQVATPQDLYNKPCNQFVASFIGSPPMNFFAGELQSAEGDTEFVGDGVRIPIANYETDLPANVTLGIRPDHFTLDDRDMNDKNPKVSATIELVEFAGESTFVHLIAGATKFVAVHRNSSRDEGYNNDAVGRSTQASVDITAAHLFDQATGERLALRPGP